MNTSSVPVSCSCQNSDDDLTNEVHATIQELKLARCAFDWADPEFVDSAIHRLRAAESKLTSLLHCIKAKRGVQSLTINLVDQQ